MPKLVVQGREYVWPDPTTITFRESKTIKDSIGLSILQILQNLGAGQVDEDVLLSMFLLAKLRTDGDFDIESVMNLNITDIGLEADDEEEAEEDEDPLAEVAPDDAESPKPVASKPKSKSASSTA